MAIDAMARVADGARIGDGVEVGPYCVVGPHVELKTACASSGKLTLPAQRRSAKGPPSIRFRR